MLWRVAVGLPGRRRPRPSAWCRPDAAGGLGGEINSDLAHPAIQSDLAHPEIATATPAHLDLTNLDIFHPELAHQDLMDPSHPDLVDPAHLDNLDLSHPHLYHPDLVDPSHPDLVDPSVPPGSWPPRSGGSFPPGSCPVAPSLPAADRALPACSTTRPSPALRQGGVNCGHCVELHRNACRQYHLTVTYGHRGSVDGV